MDKVVSSPAEAVADIPAGASVAIAGFGVRSRFPTSLIMALRDRGVGELTVVCNSLGGAEDMRGQLLAQNRQIRRLVASFSARPGGRSAAEELIASGDMDVELVPQGILVERLRAGAAGLAAFYSPVGVGTEIAAGKETRNFHGRPYLLEQALQVDYSLVWAPRADRFGNLEFRGGSQNFNPVFAKAARVTIAEVEQIVAVGEILPERVGLPGIFVDRVVASTTTVPAQTTAGGREKADRAQLYLGRPGLTRMQMAARAARLLPDGSCVNLGLGIPTLVSNFIAGRNIMLHAENGILGYGGFVSGDDIDEDVYNAASQFVSLQPGASFFDSVTSFEIARSGRLSAVILGAYQVDESGSFANWSTPEMIGGGIGGAMDLAVDRNRLIIMMNHLDSKGRPKLVSECSYPLTARECVDVVVTDLALLERVDGRFLLLEVAPGFTPSDVLALTPMAVTVPPDVRTMDPSTGGTA